MIDAVGLPVKRISIVVRDRKDAASQEKLVKQLMEN